MRPLFSSRTPTRLGRTWRLSRWVWIVQDWALTRVFWRTASLDVEDAFEALLRSSLVPGTRHLSLATAEQRRTAQTQALLWRHIARSLATSSFRATWMAEHLGALDELWSDLYAIEHFRRDQAGRFVSRAHAKLHFWHARARHHALHSRHQPIWHRLFYEHPILLWPLALHVPYSCRLVFHTSCLIPSLDSLSPMEAAAAVGVLCASWHAWGDTPSSQHLREQWLPSFQQHRFSARLDGPARLFCAHTWAGLGSRWAGNTEPDMALQALRACLRERFFDANSAFQTAQQVLQAEGETLIPSNFRVSKPSTREAHVLLALLSECQDAWMALAASPHNTEAPLTPQALHQWAHALGRRAQQWTAAFAQSPTCFSDASMGRAMEQGWNAVGVQAERFALRLAIDRGPCEPPQEPPGTEHSLSRGAPPQSDLPASSPHRVRRL